jgi:hypothetical protein
MKGSQRISVRLDDRQSGQLRTRCQQAGCDVSQVVREALEQFLSLNLKKSADSETPARSARPPEQILNIITPIADSGRLRTQEDERGGVPTAVIAKGNVEGRQSEHVDYEFPQALKDQLAGFRAFGMELRKERRRLFQATLAATQVARENSQDGRDEDLYFELVRLGRNFGFL